LQTGSGGTIPTSDVQVRAIVAGIIRSSVAALATTALRMSSAAPLLAATQISDLDGMRASSLDAEMEGRGFSLLPPGSNDVAVHVGSSAGNSFDGMLDRGGPWTIRVYQMRSAERRGTVAACRLSVSVTRGSGMGGQAAQMSGDAMVAGTGYNATGPVDCLLSPGAPNRQCNAGVRGCRCRPEPSPCSVPAFS
jgi:hypothetical protein